MKISILKRGEVSKIKDLVYTYRFNDYRSYRMLNKNKLKEYLFMQILDSFKEKGNRLLIAEDKKEIVGLITLDFSPWDTRHFGIKMAKIGYMMAKEDYGQNSAIKNDLLSYLFQLCKDEKIVFLSSRIDVDDISSIHVLEQNGFNVMDILVTYTFNRYKHNIPKIKDIYMVRRFTKQDLPILIDIAENAFSKDHFHLDSNIPKKKADRLFGKWVQNCCEGKYADTLFVAEKDDRAIGFLTFIFNKELKKSMGYKVCGRGLSAVSSGIKGAYPALVKAAIEDISLHYDCLEFDTQLNNYEVIRIWQRFCFDFIRAKYTFHRWLK